MTTMNEAGMRAMPNRISRAVRRWAEKLLADRFAVRAEKEQDEPDEQHRVEQRQREHERRVEGAVGEFRLHAEGGEDGDDDDLRREAGAEDDFQRGRGALDREAPPVAGPPVVRLSRGVGSSTRRFYGKRRMEQRLTNRDAQGERRGQLDRQVGALRELNVLAARREHVAGAGRAADDRALARVVLAARDAADDRRPLRRAR